MILFLGLVSLAVLLTFVLFRPRSGSPRGVEVWLGQAIRGIAGWYLEPEIQFDAISYVAPTGVKLTNFRLTAPDAAGVRHDFVTAVEASIELGRLPRPGEPIVIRQINLLDPQVKLIAMSADDPRLVGFSNLLKTNDAAAPEAGSVFEIRRLGVSNGRFVYDPRVERTTPLTLDQIDCELLLVESDDGSLSIDLDIDRDTVLQVLLSGSLDLDDKAVRTGDLRVDVGLDRGDRSHLPPQLQVWLDRFGVEGRLVARIQGDVPLARPVESQLSISATLTDARAILSGLQPSIQRLDLGARTDGGTLWIDQFVASTMGGSIDFAGTMRMNRPGLVTTARLAMLDLKLDQLEPMTGSDDRLEGVVSGRLNLVDAPLATLNATNMSLPTAWGSGNVEILDMRAVRVPVIGVVVDQLFRLMSLSSDAKARDRIAFVFDLTDEGFAFRSIDYSGPLIAGRGTGTMSLDGRLNLRVNAGPLERLQGSMGGVGRAIGNVTDRIGGYRIQGTVASPIVEPIILGR
jgi:hypothetical protein